MLPLYRHRNFVKQFKKLPREVRKKFEERLKLFMDNPFVEILNNHSVEKVFPGCRSINITGDYRAIYKYEDDIVTFVNIGTHSELYK
jgi:addiction module RelE/StbE family toxin